MLTDAQIAILCDIGQASSFDERKKGEVLDLVVRGYVERDGDLFKVTPRGETNHRTHTRGPFGLYFCVRRPVANAFGFH